MTLPQLAAAALIVLLGVITTPTARAAAELSRSIPAPGAQIPEAPSELELFFTQEVLEARIIINGSEVEGQVDEDHVRAPIDSLAEGNYLVEWIVISDVDDRETSGNFQFQVRPETEDETPPEVDPDTRAERVEEVGDDNRTEVLLWTILGIAAMALLALVFFYFRTSIPTFGTTGVQGGLPPPGESPPEKENDGPH
jgi:methionine-rich copper-binding protein CopC